LLKTRCNLQFQLEKAIQKRHDIELNNEMFTNAAFEMHPKAYLDAGLADLSISDLWHIGLTPEIGEWKSWLTWKQAFKVAPPVLEGLSKQYIKPGIPPWDIVDPNPAY
jgi:hypothetical protein